MRATNRSRSETKRSMLPSIELYRLPPSVAGDSVAADLSVRPATVTPDGSHDVRYIKPLGECQHET